MNEEERTLTDVERDIEETFGVFSNQDEGSSAFGLDPSLDLGIPDFKAGVDSEMYKTLPSGAYSMKLIDIKKGTMRKFQSTEEGPAIIFAFQEVRSGTKVFKRCPPSVHPKSNCRKMLNSLSPREIDSAILASNEAVWNYLKSRIGSTFLVQIETKKTQAGGAYSKIENVLPLEGITS
jgi:hypothetical protein